MSISIHPLILEMIPCDSCLNLNVKAKEGYGSTDEHIEYNDGEADVTQELRIYSSSDDVSSSADSES